MNNAANIELGRHRGEADYGGNIVILCRSESPGASSAENITLLHLATFRVCSRDCCLQIEGEHLKKYKMFYGRLFLIYSIYLRLLLTRAGTTPMKESPSQ